MNIPVYRIAFFFSLFLCLQLNTLAQVTLISDINPGASDSAPHDFVTLNDKVYFNVNMNDPLFEYDPLLPASSTNPKRLISNIDNWNMYAFNGKLYTASFQNSQIRNEPYVFDPAIAYSSSNPFLLKDISTDPLTNSSAIHFTGCNGLLYFIASDTEPEPNDFALNSELWVYNDALPLSATNPKVVIDVNAGWSGATKGLTNVNGKLYYFGTMDNATPQLLQYDPALVVSASNPAALVSVSDSYNATSEFFTPSPSAYMILGTTLYYTNGTAANTNEELYAYDMSLPKSGTNPKMLMDLNPGSAGSLPNAYVQYNNKLYFIATTAATGTELFVFDPALAVSSANPKALELVAGATGSAAAEPVLAFGKIYYTANASASIGAELYVYDPATAASSTNPSLFADIATGSTSSTPSKKRFIAECASIFMSASTSGYGSEPYRYAFPVARLKTSIGTSTLVSGSALSFGSTDVTTGTVTKILTLRNTGNVALLFTDPKAVFSGTNAAEFSVDLSGLPASLAVGATASVSITFDPSGAGAKTAAFIINSSDPNVPQFTVQLNGTATKTNQTIQFSAPDPVTYGHAPIPLTATSTSGLTVTYISSDPLIVSITGNVATILKSGSVQITAAQNGNTAYNTATAVSQPLSIAKAALSCTPATTARLYGDADPVFTINYSGFVNGDDAGDITPPTASTTTLVNSPVSGSPYTVNLIGGVSDNYTFTLHSGTMGISKAPLQITADDKSRAQNRTVSYTYSVNGYKAGESATEAFTGAPVMASTASDTSPEDEYPILITQGSMNSANYELHFTNGTLTITVVSGVIDKSGASVSLYPNPSVNGEFDVTLKGINGSVTKITLINSLGQEEVFYQTHISTACRGIAVILIETTEGSYSKKILLD